MSLLKGDGWISFSSDHLAVRNGEKKAFLLATVLINVKNHALFIKSANIKQICQDD